jgi:hypothetical protein
MSHGNRFKDMTGRTVGRLTVLAYAGLKGHMAAWRCRCSCGNETVVSGNHLRLGRTRSCGCGIGANLATHRASGLPEYTVWQVMIQRCTNPKDPSFSIYGPLGVYEGWRHDFVAFLAHVGPRPTPEHQLERLDNSKGYFPGNVGWATRLEQNSNRRDNVWLEHDGQRMTVAGWARHLGCSHGLLYKRWRKGWPVERILTPPAGG